MLNEDSNSSRPAATVGQRPAPKPDVIIPNLHRRYSGVTATNRMIAPQLARFTNLAWLGPHRPDGVARLSMAGLLRLRSNRQPIIWHARRNNEMIVGLLAKLLGWRLKLIFTSAAQRPHTWITRLLMRHMDVILTISKSSASYLKIPARIILHGVDTDLYRPPADRAAAFNATGLPGRYAIGCFGRVRWQKGTDLFVEAMCRLLPRYPDFTAVIIGAVDDREFADRLEAQAKAAGLADRIRLFGELPVHELPPWFARLTIYAFTSRNEGFGLTLLEAMAAGVALVAARAGAADIVIEDGTTGLLVPPGDVDALVAALDALMSDPHGAQEMGARAREHVVRHFSVEAEAEQIAAVYHEVLCT